jgi:hypothetical protein
MNGLRVYVSPTAPKMPGRPGVFYSRRADGPFYRWLYEETLGRWCGSRISPSALTPKTLNIASWKDIPIALQSKLREHYLE